MKKRIGIQGFLIFASTCAAILFYKFLFPSSCEKWAYDFIGIIGMVLVIKGYLLRISARGAKSEINTDGKTLVVSGPYQLTRNPMYLGTLLIGLGVSFALFKWWVGCVFAAAYLLIYIPQIKLEEKILSERFGGAFKDYCLAVPRFFPRGKCCSSMAPASLPIRKGWIMKEASSMAAVFFAILLVTLWQEFALFGRIRYRMLALKLLIAAAYAIVVYVLHYEKNIAAGNCKGCCK